ncbi:hypothetical protein PIB30_091797 [Stylosanthes scabra]|uniref:GRF-type domain-containing protein n=1 Tax=Stylosanthes scabra TaxID=79078 RepID=A0ABU6UX58_9FABA|nr:hypothetical protein [Stylosanthes scabra]
MASMASEGGTSSSRRRAISDGLRVVHAGDEIDSIAPRCFCGLHAIMYMSKTKSNPSRLFLGCPNYNKLKLGDHCKYFHWLDEHDAKIGGKFGGNIGCEMISYGGNYGETVVGDSLKKRVDELEKKVAVAEKRKNVNGCAFEMDGVGALIMGCLGLNCAGA